MQVPSHGPVAGLRTLRLQEAQATPGLLMHGPHFKADPT